MKRIFKLLKKIEAKGYYYRAVVSSNHIDIKLYLDNQNTSPETNFAAANNDHGIYQMHFNLETFLHNLTQQP
jgi:hypothetical protein